MPIIFPDHVTHSQVKVTDAIPVSAGFFRVDSFGKVEIYGTSESLKLGPLKEDDKLIFRVLNNFPISSYLDL